MNTQTISVHATEYSAWKNSVYLVDDDYLMVENLEKLITEKVGWRKPEKSYDTDTALREIVARFPEIVLADIRFAGNETAGIELITECRKLIRSCGHQSPFVIFVTGLGEEGLLAASKVPFSLVLQKPLRESDLISALEIACSEVRNLRRLRDAQWALRSLENGEFDKLEGEYIGVFNQKVVSTGDDEELVRLQVSKTCGVPPSDVIIEHKGEPQ